MPQFRKGDLIEFRLDRYAPWAQGVYEGPYWHKDEIVLKDTVSFYCYLIAMSLILSRQDQG